MLRLITAGESHGPMLVGILEGLPAGLELSAKDLMPRMKRRQGGYGRGKRMQLEVDTPQIVAGLWKGKTTGAPLAILVENRSNRQGRTQVRKTTPRPGHADMAGMLKYGFNDANPVIERASARETAIRTALGAVACHLLEQLGVELSARVVSLGGIVAPPLPEAADAGWIAKRREASDVACCDDEASRQMIARVDEAKERGESLGGQVELVVFGLPPGLGSYVQWDRRLDSRLAAAMMSIPSAKGVEIGEAFDVAQRFGRSAHDPIETTDGKVVRTSNLAGGLEGGVTNGEPLVVRVTHKPIPTQRKPLATVDMDTGEPVKGRYIRSDTAVVPAAAVIAECVAAAILADAMLEKFGADRIDLLSQALDTYREQLPHWRTTRTK